MKALSKWRKTTTLPWGAEISLRILGFSVQTFTVSHAGVRPDGLAMRVVPIFSSNRDLGVVSINPAPENTVGGSTTFTVTNPRKGDVLFVDHQDVIGHGASAGFFVYTGWRWKPMQTRWPDTEHWGTDRYFLSADRDSSGRRTFSLYVDLEEVGSYVVIRDDELPCKDMFDFLVGRRSFVTLLNYLFARAKVLQEQGADMVKILQHEVDRLKDDRTRLRLAGRFFADRIWKTRGFSKSEFVAEARRQFEAVLFLKRIEHGTDLGKLTEINHEEAKEIILATDKRLRELASGKKHLKFTISKKATD